MKNLIIPIILLLNNAVFAQLEAKEGIPLEYSETKEVSFKIFSPALRINKTIKQSNIDYSKVEGLLQSYFSATDSIWDKSDYLDKNHKSVKDMEHYKSVKKSNADKEYVEIESIYEFTHNNQKRNYVKYALTIDGLPFQIVTVLSCVEVNKRWYIDNLFNQSNALSLLSKLNSEKLKLLFQSDKTTDKIINEIKLKCSIDGIIDINLLYDCYDIESKNEQSLIMKNIRDQRNWVENYQYPKAAFKVVPTSTALRVTMPFSLNDAVFSVYDKGENLLTNTPETLKKVKDNVEKLLIPSSQETVKLIHKPKFTYGDSTQHIIKYEKGGKFYVENLPNDKTDNKDQILLIDLKNVILKIKPNTFLDLNSNETISKSLESIRSQSTSITEKMLNLTVLNRLLEKNKVKLAPFLD